jgi:hypothetical protein
MALLAMLVLSPRPAAATAITYDFSGTLQFGPYADPTNKSITGQFTIDFDTQTITGFDFQTPSGEVSASTWYSALFMHTPALAPADNFVQLAFFNGDGTLVLLFRTTLDAFDGNTFYTSSIDIQGGGTGAGFECTYMPSCTTRSASPFVGGAAAPHTDPPPPTTVPEPTTMALVGGGLVAIAARRGQTGARQIAGAEARSVPRPRPRV